MNFPTELIVSPDRAFPSEPTVLDSQEIHRLMVFMHHSRITRLTMKLGEPLAALIDNQAFRLTQRVMADADIEVAYQVIFGDHVRPRARERLHRMGYQLSRSKDETYEMSVDAIGDTLEMWMHHPDMASA